jgi:hypothetical protein
MSEDLNEYTTPADSQVQPITATVIIQEPVCSVCGLSLHVLKGGLQVSNGSITNVAILGCTNNNYFGTHVSCTMFNQEQSRNETPINLFEG